MGTTKFKHFDDKEKCARNADVIITATSPGKVALVKYEWLKEGVHINGMLWIFFLEYWL